MKTARIDAAYTLDNIRKFLSEGRKVHCCTRLNDTSMEVTVGHFFDIEFDGELLLFTINGHKNDLDQFSIELKDDTTELSKYWRKDRLKTFILIDIVNYSKGDHDKQIRSFSLLRTVINERNEDTSIDFTPFLEAMIPTGDGCYIIMSEKGAAAAFWYIRLLLKRINRLNGTVVGPDNIYIKAAMHFGAIDYAIDMNKRWNYVGDGINDTQRILSSIPKEQLNAIHVSEEIFRLQPPSPVNVVSTDFPPITYGPLISFSDKHGKSHLFRQMLV